MGQQQDSQASSSQSEDAEEQQASSSHWLSQDRNRSREAPKSEHPSTYDESVPSLGYHAQDAAQTSSSSPRTQRSSTQNSQKNRRASNADLASDADAFETTYRPYSQYTGRWQVPPWAQPQQNNAGTLQLLVLLMIDIIVFPALCVILRGVAVVNMGAWGFLVVPFIILGALLLGFTILAFLSIRRAKPPR